jgi:hypothetical protein
MADAQGKTGEMRKARKMREERQGQCARHGRVDARVQAGQMSETIPGIFAR